MSEVILVVVSKGKVQVIRNHYRIIEKIVEDGPENLEVIKQGSVFNLDEGYIIYDSDNNLILNAQTAFSLTKKGFAVLNVI